MDFHSQFSLIEPVMPTCGPALYLADVPYILILICAVIFISISATMLSAGCFQWETQRPAHS